MGLWTPSRPLHGRAVPAQIALHTFAGRPVRPGGFRYLLMLRRAAACEDLRPRKPAAFHSLDAMARHLHRVRAGRPLQLADEPLMVAGQDDAQPGVGVYLVDPIEGQPRRYLGWAWVNGAGIETLRAGLSAVQPESPHVE